MNLGPVIGIAATAAIAVGLYFLFSNGGNKAPEATGPTAVPTPTAAAPPAKTTETPQATAPSPAQPSGVPLLPPLPEREAKQTIDLLALTDPVLDRVPVPGMVAKNEWKRDGKALAYVSDGKSGKLAPPVAFNSRDYEIEFIADRLSGNERIHVDIPLASDRIVPLVLNSPNRKVLNEKAGDAWGSSQETVHVVIRVADVSGTGDRITIRHGDSAGSPLVDWSGDLRTLGKTGEPHPAFPGEQVASVFLMKDAYVIKTWTLRVFEGEAKVLREAAPAVANAPASAPGEAAMTASVSAPAAAAPSPSAPSPIPPTPAPMPQPVVPTPLLSDPHLARLAAGFQGRYDTDAQKPYLAAVAALNQSYVNNGIARARAAAQQRGALDEVTALDAEKARIQNNEGLPPADLESLPASLKQIRATYRAALAKHEADRAQKAAPLYDIYLKALDAYIIELTKANKLDDARKTKELRDQIASQKPDVEAPVAPSNAKAPMQNRGTVAKAAEEPQVTASGRSPWQDAALWVLSVGGRLEVLKNGQPLHLQKEADIPPGKFDITFFEIDGANPRAAAIKDDDFSRFSGMKELKTIRLVSVKISDAAFAFLPTTPAVQILMLSYLPEVTDGIFTHIAPLRQLAELQFQDCPKMSGTGFEKLASLPVLKSLSTSRTSFGDAGVRVLAEAASLENLTAEGGPITDEGVAVLANHKKLALLNISGTKVTDECLGSIGKMKALRVLALSGCAGITGRTFEALLGLPNLKELTMTGVQIDPAVFPIIGRLAGLETMSLSNVRSVDDEALTALSGMAGLRYLNLDGCQLTGTGCAGMKASKDLTTLYCSDSAHISNDGMRAIAAAFPKLTTLSLGTGEWNAEGVKDIATLKNLSYLHLRSDGKHGDAEFAEAARCRMMGTLNLHAFGVTDAGLAKITDLKMLGILDLSGCSQITDASIPTLSKLRLLSTIRVTGTAITDDGVAALKKALPRADVQK